MEELCDRSILSSYFHNFLSSNSSKESSHRWDYSIRESSNICNHLFDFIVNLFKFKSIFICFQRIIDFLSNWNRFLNIHNIISRPSLMFYSELLNSLPSNMKMSWSFKSSKIVNVEHSISSCSKRIQNSLFQTLESMRKRYFNIFNNSSSSVIW